MKTLTLTLATLFSILFVNAQETKGASITVTIDNVVSDKGKVLVSLHSQDTFMKGPGIQDLESTIKDGKVILTFEGVPSGTYAILALHDVNENQRMDFENGMPKESYGMSNNEMIMGPPTFDSAKFEVDKEDLEFNIRF